MERRLQQRGWLTPDHMVLCLCRLLHDQVENWAEVTAGNAIVGVFEQVVSHAATLQYRMSVRNWQIGWNQRLNKIFLHCWTAIKIVHAAWLVELKGEDDIMQGPPPFGLREDPTKRKWCSNGILCQIGFQPPPQANRCIVGTIFAENR